MNRIAYLFVCLSLLMSSCLNARELWEIGTPATADIRQGVSIGHDYLKLHVPESFEGKNAEEWRNTFTAEVSNLIRFSRADSEVQLRGSVTRFDFDYTQDIIDIQVYRSKETMPGGNSCMDCHGGKFPKTIATVGYVKEKMEAKPYRFAVGSYMTISDATSDGFRGEINHWLNSKLMVKGAVQAGEIEQGRYKLDGKSFTLGLAGTAWHRFTWSGDLNISKADTYSSRKTLIGNLGYRIFKGVKLTLGGAAFLDGYTQYGTEMSVMSKMTTKLRHDNPDRLPALFNRLKNDSFGYWHFAIECEHQF